MNIRRFIGTNGLYQAIYHGVPVVGVPLLVDQFDNMLRVTERGAGVTLDITTLTSDELYETVSRYFRSARATPRELSG